MSCVWGAASEIVSRKLGIWMGTDEKYNKNWFPGILCALYEIVLVYPQNHHTDDLPTVWESRVRKIVFEFLRRHLSTGSRLGSTLYLSQAKPSAQVSTLATNKYDNSCSSSDSNLFHCNH